MTPREIKARMSALGITPKDLLRSSRKSHKRPISKTAISFLINRKMTSNRLERWLAKKLRVSVERLRNGKLR